MAPKATSAKKKGKKNPKLSSTAGLYFTDHCRSYLQNFKEG